MPLDPELLTQIITDVASIVSTWLPNLIGALILLLLGWLVARIAQFILAGLLRRLRFDNLADRAGVSDFLANAGLDPSVANLIARLVYWLVLLMFVLAAAESLGLAGVVGMLGGFVAYLPSVLAAALILLLGGLIARFVGDAVGALAEQAGIAAGPILGQAVRYVLLVFAIILGLEQLGIETSLLIMAATAIITATALALALAFGIGSRDLARNIMAGFHAKEEFNVGQNITVRGYTGRLVSIGTVKSVIATENGLISLPNSVLTEEEVTFLESEETSL